MRILILGAGGIGGYYGARIAAAGGDVSFLVRAPRAAQIRSNGLRVQSTLGDLLLAPPVLTREEIDTPFDFIFISCKSYDLASAIEAIAPAVGEASLIVPLLNGVRHIDQLDARFGSERVLGGVAFISVALQPDGEIRHLNSMHRLFIGARFPEQAERLAPLATLLASANFEFVCSETIEQAMWDKFAFLTALASATCLFRASVGQILQTSAGEDFTNDLLDECAAVADACGHPLDGAQLDTYRQTLTDRSSSLMASMLRDVERGGATEAEHILGDMFMRGQQQRLATPMLQLAYAHLQAYEIRRQSERGA